MSNYFLLPLPDLKFSELIGGNVLVANGTCFHLYVFLSLPNYFSDAESSAKIKVGESPLERYSVSEVQTTHDTLQGGPGWGATGPFGGGG